MASLRRFLHLERERPHGPSAPRASAARERFEAVEPAVPGGRPAPAGPPAAGAPPDDGALALDPPGADDPPFVRCPCCERDHERHAVACAACGAALEGEGVRRFNAELWRSRVEANRADDRLSAEREEARRRAEGEAARARLALAEVLSARILDRERERSRRPWPRRALAWMARLLGARIDPPPSWP